MKNFLLSMLFSLLCIQCHAYKAYNKNEMYNPFVNFIEQGGYCDFYLDEGHYMVTYESTDGNGTWEGFFGWNQKIRAKSDQVVFNNAFRRCIELTIDQGYKYFEILSEKGEDVFKGTKLGPRIGGVLTTFPTYKYKATVEIKCFNEYKEGSYEAQSYLWDH